LDAHCPFQPTVTVTKVISNDRWSKAGIILFIFTIPKVFVLATIFSQKLLSRINFRGFKQFDFLTRAFQIIIIMISLINNSGILKEFPQKAL